MDKYDYEYDYEYDFPRQYFGVELSDDKTCAYLTFEVWKTKAKITKEQLFEIANTLITAAEELK